ncbi:MAG: hypothetical protein ACF787_13615 [Rhodopirellula sp. JB053]
MAKYYVQSGTFRRVVAADSSRKAALWAVNEVMQQILPTEEAEVGERSRCSAAHSERCHEKEPEQKVTVLSAKVRVGERGFDRDDANEMSTMEVVGEWNQMAMTLYRLQEMLDGAGTDRTGSLGRVTGSMPPAKRFTDDQISDDLAA